MMLASDERLREKYPEGELTVSEAVKILSKSLP